jgi:hypothetical protein
MIKQLPTIGTVNGQNPLVFQVPEDTKFQTESGHFYERLGHGYRDELGQYVYPKDEEEKCNIIREWPGIREREQFELITKPKGVPNQGLIFKAITGFRVLVRMENYKFHIPFNFKSTDPRVGRYTAKWSGDRYKMLEALWEKSLSITYEQKKPILFCDSWSGSLQIPSC